ncbi:MAG: 16S rRNA (adenine(1518)-N(6)/adenine(1519)-N(6))-dimethyltransferase RsmA [Pseudomonadota bacterium]
MSDLLSLPPLRDIIDAHDLRAKKSLGQNFLLDLNITEKIVRLAGDLSGCHVFEIGPGPGGLTRALVNSEAEKITAIEFDTRAIKALQSLIDVSNDRLKVIESDALQTNLFSLGDAPRAIVANLPYNIATPLLVNWLRQIYEDRSSYRSMTLMFQKEVAQRITARVGDKHYGRLAVLTQWLCDADIVMDLSPKAFTPPPKVTSSVVHLRPKEIENSPSFEAVETITAAAFGQRRKMIRSSLKAYKEHFDDLGLNPETRAENLSVEDYITLAKAVS